MAKNHFGLENAAALNLARAVKTRVGWLDRDVLALAGPDLDDRRDLFDFIVAELQRRESRPSDRIRPRRLALARQREDLLGFARVLDRKLAEIAEPHRVPE